MSSLPFWSHHRGRGVYKVGRGRDSRGWELVDLPYLHRVEDHFWGGAVKRKTKAREDVFPTASPYLVFHAQTKPGLMG